MKKIIKKASNLKHLLLLEQHHIALIKKHENDNLNGYSKDLYNHSKRQLSRIRLELTEYSDYELMIGRSLGIGGKDTVYKKCKNLSISAHDYIKSINDFELDEEKPELINDFQMFLIAFILSNNVNAGYTYNDLFQLSNSALTETQFDKLIFDLKIGNTDEGIKTALSNNETNNYKGD